MARQMINIVVTQASSGAGLAITTTYTSDGVVVTSSRQYQRDPGGFTMDNRMAAELRVRINRLVAEIAAECQLF